MSGFEGKVVLITGAGSGIGRATALAFAQAGAKVGVADVDGEKAEQSVALITDQRGEGLALEADVTDEDAVQAMVAATVQQYGRLDIAVNNAGIGGSRATTHTYPQESWHQVLAVNLTGVWLCMQAEIEVMLAQGQGAIVNVASVAGLVGFQRHCAYAASKHGVIGLTRTAALEYAQLGLRINAICPAFTDTPLIQQVVVGDKAREERLIQGIPMQRLAEAGEIAQSILYLASEQASFVTGHALTVDGGLTAQ